MISGLRQLHENERLVDLAEGVAGRVCLWAVATALLAWHGAGHAPLAALAAVIVDPARKRLWLSVAAAAFLLDRLVGAADIPLRGAAAWGAFALASAGGIAAIYVAFRLACELPCWPALRRRPVWIVHTLVWSALFASHLPGLGLLGMVPFFAWRMSYLAASAAKGGLSGTRFRDHLFYLLPVWGGTTTPYGKGLDFLARHEADEPRSLALSRLAGVKLLLLATAWVFAREAIDVLAFGSDADLLAGRFGDGLRSHTLDWPRLSARMRSGAPGSWPIDGAILYVELVRATLVLAAAGHVVIGALRLFGFPVFRNTWKPLLAESVLEFWNRYYFYFKELLVDFFFYPTFLRLRRVHPSLRLFGAVFAAAFLGNAYHHVLAHPEPVLRLDFDRAWATWGPRLVYGFLLALGIWVSMLRERGRRAAGAEVRFPVRLRRIAGVWTFYALLQIWNVAAGEVGFEDRATFFLALFGVPR